MRSNIVIVLLLATAFAGFPALASGETAPPATQVPDWLVGTLTGNQTVVNRPSWPPSPVTFEVADDGSWELRLGGIPSPAIIKGTVTEMGADSVTLKGTYTRGRNYGKEVTYQLQLVNGKIRGPVTADWITTPIEVELAHNEAF